MMSPAMPALSGEEALRHAQERLRFRQRHLPDVQLLDHEGRAVRFYRDVVRDRRVVIGVMYSSCQNLCLPVTRNLVEAQKLLGPAAQGLNFVMISLTPLEDRPADLKRYMRTHGLERGWTLLTGMPPPVEEVTMALGLRSRDPGELDLTSHATKLRIGDEPQVRWGHAQALVGGRSLARMIRFELA